jgi:hypothetical protein
MHTPPVWSLVALLLAGCGASDGDSPPVGSDASVDARDASSVDASGGEAAASDTNPAAMDAACDVGPIPTVAPFSAEFVFLDADAGVTFPTPTGGDPKGTWRYAKLTAYLSPAARSLLDVSKSKVEGSGYSRYDDTSFVNAFDQKFTLETTVVGTLTRGTTSQAKGAWKLEGNELVFTPECAATTGDSAVSRVGFSRLAADKARIQFKPPPSGVGDYNQQIVIDLELVK